MIFFENQLLFNRKSPSVMHIDINSCFATIEQQANPLLRGKPVGVAARNTTHGCILAASIEAKKIGVKTGFRIHEAKMLCPDIVIITADPNKYRDVHYKLKQILENYTPKFEPKSIDEFVLHFETSPYFQKGLINVAKEIKNRIRTEIGNVISVSIGIGPNRFLAKTAAGLKKPDGLEVIDFQNFKQIYSKLTLTDLTGINTRNELRLNSVGIFSVTAFYNADITTLRSAFKSVLANYWYAKLRGFETDDYQTHRRTFGQSYVLPKPVKIKEDILPIAQKLTEKMGYRMRKAGYCAGGLHLGLLFQKDNRTKIYWHKGEKFKNYTFDSIDLFKQVGQLLNQCLFLGKYDICFVSVNTFEVLQTELRQLEFFEDIFKKEQRVKHIDLINQYWGSFKITPARMLSAKTHVRDAISFGQVEDIG